jgi:sugar phosphate isomerase/epimerase
MLQISIVLDELSSDPETALELGTAWGVKHFELRGFFVERVPLLTAYQKYHLREILAAYRAEIVALSPGLYKMPYPGREPTHWSFTCLDEGAYQSWSDAHHSVYVHSNEILPATLDYANELGVKTVVIFGFHRNGLAPGFPPDEVLQTLYLAAEKAASAGIVLALETEDGYWADTGERQAQILEAVNHPALRANWDPGNAFCAGDVPYPTGYNALKKFIHHIHFKDARKTAGGQSMFVTHGDIDWPGQIKALSQDGYNGFISIETHQRPKIASAKASLDRLRELIEANQ